MAAALPPFLAAGGGWGWRPCIRAFGDFWRFRDAAPYSIPGEEGAASSLCQAVTARVGACPWGSQLEAGAEVATVVGAPCSVSG